MRTFASPAALLAALLLAAPARGWWFGPRAKSHWRRQAIWVDGDPDEWPESWRGDDNDIAFAFANDADYLYVLFAPRSPSTRLQFGGAYEQDLELWLDPKAGLARRVLLTLGAPKREAAGWARSLRLSGGQAAAGAIQMQVGRVDLHGALEARLPLALLGLPLPRRITVGIQASKPAKTPAPLPAPQGVSSELLGTEDSGQHRGARGGEPFVLVRTWARVTLARPPKK